MVLQLVSYNRLMYLKLAFADGMKKPVANEHHMVGPQSEAIHISIKLVSLL